MKKFAFGLLLFLTFHGAAIAQTAEETVAFILLGLEDGRAIELPGGAMRMRKADGAGASYSIVKPDGSTFFHVTVQETGPCNFDLSGEGADGKRRQTSIDFNRFIGVSTVGKSGTMAELRFAGECPIKADGECKSTETIIFDDRSPPRERFMAAIDYLRQQYCKGSAF